MVSPVEGVDYIIDRYAVLGLDPTATDDEIKKAISAANVANHPDTLARASDEIKKMAHRARALIQKCSEVLKDPVKKAAYDVRLNWFKENEPQLISVDGIPIISPKRYHVDLDMLITGQSIDQGDVLSALDTLAANGSARNVRLLERGYLLDPTDAETKAAYKEALAMRLGLLTEQERLAWEAAGIGYGASKSQMLVDAADYGDGVLKQIEHIRTQVLPDIVEQRSMALLAGTGTPLLLPSSGDSNAEPTLLGHPLGEEEKAAITAKAAATFAERTHRLKQLGDEKQAILLKLLDLSEHHHINPGAQDTGYTNIFLMFKSAEAPEPVVVLAQRMDNATHAGEILDAYNGKSLSDLKKAGLMDDSHAVEIEPELLAQDYALTHIPHLYKKIHGMGQDRPKS